MSLNLSSSVSPAHDLPPNQPVVARALSTRDMTETLPAKREYPFNDVPVATRVNNARAVDTSLQSKSSLFTTNTKGDLKLLIDQGGASFTAYLFGPDGVQLGILKSSKDQSVIDAKLVAQLNDATSGFQLYNPEDRTFNDFSTMNAKHYALLCSTLAAAYCASASKLLNATREKRDSTGTNSFFNGIIVRQTGKIRSVLLDPRNIQKRHQYEIAMTGALGPNVEYSLLSNNNEAELEAGAFFSMNQDRVTAQHVGIGVGSSSTQVYGKSKDGVIHFSCMSTLGAKPTQKEAADGKSVECFQEQFESVLKTVLAKVDEDELTLIALNAIGYTVNNLTQNEEYAELQTKVANAQTISPRDLLQATQTYHTKVGSFGSSLLLGFARAVKSYPRIQHVLLDRRGKNGKALPYESSWIKYTVFSHSSGTPPPS